MTPNPGAYVRVNYDGVARTGILDRALTKPVDLRDGSIMFVLAGFEVITVGVGRVEIDKDAMRWSDANRCWEAEASPFQESPCLH